MLYTFVLISHLFSPASHARASAHHWENDVRVHAVEHAKPGHRSNREAWVKVIAERRTEHREGVEPPRRQRSQLKPEEIDALFTHPSPYMRQGILSRQTFIPITGAKPGAWMDMLTADQRDFLNEHFQNHPDAPLLLKIEQLEWQQSNRKMRASRWKFDELSKDSNLAKEIQAGLSTVFRNNVLAHGGYSPETLDQLIEADLNALQNGGFLFHFLVDPRARTPEKRFHFSARTLFKATSGAHSNGFPFELFSNENANPQLNKLLTSTLNPETPTDLGDPSRNRLGFGRVAMSPELRSIDYGMHSLSEALATFFAHLDSKDDTISVDPNLGLLGYAEKKRARAFSRQGWRAVNPAHVSSTEKEIPLDYTLEQFLREFLRPHLRYLPALKN